MLAKQLNLTVFSAGGNYGNEIYEFTYPEGHSQTQGAVQDNQDQFYHIGQEIDSQVVLLFTGLKICHSKMSIGTLGGYPYLSGKPSLHQYQSRSNHLSCIFTKL